MVYWREAGLTYLKYVSVASQAVRQALKEPARAEALKRTEILFTKREYKDGKTGSDRSRWSCPVGLV